MEEHKWRFFKSFIEHNSIGLDALLRLMKGHEGKTRGFYADCIPLPSDQFVQVDVIFVINFLLESYSSYSPTPPVRSIYHVDFFRCEVFQDMMLLENQLPFFRLQEILDFAKRTKGTRITQPSSITELSQCLLNSYMKEQGMTDLNSYNNARHFVDFQRPFYMPVEARLEPKYIGEFESIKSISKLHKAEVRIMVASRKTLLDIKFKDGVLKIPSIVVCDRTETIFRNLLAYDHGSSHISDYFALMGMLIDTADDVELLVKKKILRNDLATDQEVSKVFNNMEKEVILGDPSYYSHLCEELDHYCEKRRHKWMATLKQN